MRFAFFVGAVVGMLLTWNVDAGINPYSESLDLGAIECADYEEFLKSNLFSSDKSKKDAANAFLIDFRHWLNGFSDALNRIRAKNTGRVQIIVGDDKDAAMEVMLLCGNEPLKKIKEIAFQYAAEETELLYEKTATSNDEESSSDHIIYSEFSDWRVRHVFDQGDFSYKYSDAKFEVKTNDSSIFEAQINRSNDGKVDLIISGWIDRVILTIDKKKYTLGEKASMHTFYGSMDDTLLYAVANSKGKIQIDFFSGDKIYKGIFSSKGSSAALRWIRAIK